MRADLNPFLSFFGGENPLMYFELCQEMEDNFSKELQLEFKTVHKENLGQQNIVHKCGQQTRELKLLWRKFEHNCTRI